VGFDLERHKTQNAFARAAHKAKIVLALWTTRTLLLALRHSGTPPFWPCVLYAHTRRH